MNLRISTVPHIRCHDTTARLMLDVIIALVPTSAAAIYFFGIGAAIHMAICIAACVLSEYLYQKLTHKDIRIGDLSAVVTGLILALNLPVGAPWWMGVVGSVVAIILVKQFFGGIGDNFVNPALAARAVLLASWPVQMTSFVTAGVDAVSSATPLAGYEASMIDLFIGNIPGSIGEVSKAAILLGFLYLLVRKTISWRIPVVMIATTALFSWMLGDDPLTAILSGGVLFGAVFMASDYTTSPMTPKGQMVYAAFAGLIVVIIRNFGAYPEGVTYAILLANIITPLLDKYIRPKVYGYVAPEKTKEVKTNA